MVVVGEITLSTNLLFIQVKKFHLLLLAERVVQVLTLLIILLTRGTNWNLVHESLRTVGTLLLVSVALLTVLLDNMLQVGIRI